MPQTRQHFFFGQPHTLSLGIHALGAGRVQRSTRVQHPILDRTITFYCVILVSRGRAFFASRHCPRRELGCGACFVLFPDEMHSYGVIDGADFEETWIAFDGPAIAQAEAEGIIDRQQPCYGVGETGDLPQLLDQAYTIADCGDRHRHRILPGIVHQALIEVSRRRYAPVPKQRLRALDQLRRSIEAAADGEVDLQALARRAGLGYSTMRTQFKRFYGVSPRRYHLLQKMNHACRLLAEGAAVGETAVAVGIDDPYYFSRLFRRFIGLPPSAFAKRATGG